MPIIEITLIKGYEEPTRAAMARRVTEAILASIEAPAEAVTVVIHEVEPANYWRGARQRTPGPARQPAAEVVGAFLKAMEQRDLAEAGRHLAPDFEMVFPGGRRMRKLDELVAWAADRYRSIAKSFEGIEEHSGADETVVWCRGTLAGEWPDGETFQGVRFVDRFEIREGRIVKQEVWNDLGEAR